MTNLGNEKSQNRVHRNIVYIVSREVILGSNPLSVNHLGEKQWKIYCFSAIFPAFYRSICSRSIVFVIQTKTNYNMKLKHHLKKVINIYLKKVKIQN